MVNFKFNYNGKDIEIDVKKCETILSQARGLMFQKKSKPLLFIFKNKKRRAIHSFFCKSFIAIWFDGDKIVETKRIEKSKFSIKPEKKFNILLEIPLSDVTFKGFSDEENL